MSILKPRREVTIISYSVQEILNSTHVSDHEKFIPNLEPHCEYKKSATYNIAVTIDLGR